MGKKIVYTDHLIFRIRQRKIPEETPELILKNAQEFYYDTKTGYYVALSKIRYRGKKREMVVVFEINDELSLITSHPIKEDQKKRRVESERWTKVKVVLDI